MGVIHPVFTRFGLSVLRSIATPDGLNRKSRPLVGKEDIVRHITISKNMLHLGEEVPCGSELLK